jgi:hypothetical protein
MANTKKQESMTPTTNQDPVDLKIKRKVRLILWGGGSAEASHNSTFEWTAKNIKKDYTSRDKGKFRIVSQKINAAKDIIKYIDEYKEDEIYSLDIFTHGGPNALYLTTAEPGTNRVMRYALHNASLYRNKWLKIKNIAWSSDSAPVASLNFSKFTKNAKIELHGCATAEEATDDNNITADISKYLYKTGKKSAYAIGHAVKANPNIKGGGEKNEEQDYRHGTRIIFHNGIIIETTRKKGHLDEKYLEQLVDRREQAK